MAYLANTVTSNQTGQFYPSSNPQNYAYSGFTTGISGYLSSQLSQNGELLTSNQFLIFKTGVQRITGEKTFLNRSVVGDTGSSIYTYPLAGPVFGTNSIQQPQFLVHKNSGSSGIQVALYATNYGNIAANETTFSIIGNTIDYGTGYILGDHAVGVIGIGQNTISGQRPLIGIEGRVFAQGDASKAHIGVLGIADYIGSTVTGEMIGMESRVSLTQSGQGTQHIYSGTAISYRANRIEGGNPALRYSFFGYDTMRNHAPLQILNSGGSVSLTISTDSSDNNIRTSNNDGSIRVGPGGNGYLLLDNGVGFVGLPGGKLLGIDAFRWQLFGTSGNFSSSVEISGGLRLSSFGAGALSTDAAGNVSATSDERLKNIQSNFSRGLDAITGINPIIYKWKESGFNETLGNYAGFSAQQVKDFIPEAIGTGTNGYLSIQDRPIIAALVNAVKELKAEVDFLKRKI